MLIYLLFIASVYIIKGRLNKQFCVCVVNYSIKNTEHQLADEQQFKFHVTFIYFEIVAKDEMERFDKTENSSGTKKIEQKRN